MKSTGPFDKVRLWLETTFPSVFAPPEDPPTEHLTVEDLLDRLVAGDDEWGDEA